VSIQSSAKGESATLSEGKSSETISAMEMLLGQKSSAEEISQHGENN
jgi:hypothetical protein